MKGSDLMDDKEIIELYFGRDQRAVTESSAKYGGLCRSVAENILADIRDCDECLNDTWLSAWNAIPPQKPNYLGAFFAKITRNLSLSKWRKLSAAKRKCNEACLCIDELGECIPDRKTEAFLEKMEIREALERFLDGLPEDSRRIFLRRYWYVCSVKSIAADLEMKEGAVKMSLSRTRKRLKEHLEKEEIFI